MRVAHIITRLIVGGAQENTIASVLGLREKPGLQVHLISGPTYGPEGSLESIPSACPDLFTLVPQLVRPVHPPKDWLALRRLTRLLRSLAPDVVHTHSGKAGILGRLAAARARVPVIVHTIHGPSFGPFQPALANFVFRQVERYAAQVTTHFVVVADAMRDQYLAAGIGRPSSYTKILSGFRLEPFLSAADNPQVRAELGLVSDDIVIGKIARLFKLKGHDDLFAVAQSLVRQVPNLKFLLIGAGPWRERFDNQARALGLGKHFIFTGLVPPEKIPTLVGIIDIVVHLSLREGLPRALPQALAAGKPVVSYDCDGAREVCLENKTGFLVTPGDLRTLERRLVELGRDPSLRARFGRTGRQLVKEQFGVERMVDALYELYLRLSHTAPTSLKPV